MDTTNAIASYVRRRTHSNSTSYTDADLLVDMENRYRRICTSIVSKVQDFFWTYAFADTVVSQSEYTIGSFTFPDTTARDILTIDGASIKFTTDGGFYKLDKKWYEWLDWDLSEYEDWAWTPFYFVRDTSIFAFPTVDAAVTNWLRISWNYRPLNLTLSSDVTEIKIPLAYTWVLAEGICADYWTTQAKYDEANVFEARFVDGLDKMISNLSTRDKEISWYTY